MDLQRLTAPCRDSRCEHTGGCYEGTRAVDDHDHYRPVMSLAFPWKATGDPNDIRAMALILLAPEVGFAAGGSSFAVTTRPWTLWLSDASRDRIIARGLVGLDDLPIVASR